MTGSDTGGGAMVRIMFLGTSSLTAQDHSEERLVWMKTVLPESLALPRGAAPSGSLTYSSCSQAKRSVARG